MSENVDRTLAVFLVDSGDGARRLLKAIEKIDEGDENVEILDAAVADHHKRGRVTVKQTHDVSGRKGGVRGGSVGVIAGAVMAGPPGAAVGGALGATLAGLYARFRDIGIDDALMRKVAHDIDRGKSAVFVQYEGNWAASSDAVGEAIRAEGGELIHSTLPADKVEALEALIAPAVDDLGGEETVTDYEIEVASDAEAPAEEPEVPAAPAPPMRSGRSTRGTGGIRADPGVGRGGEPRRSDANLRCRSEIRGGTQRCRHHHLRGTCRGERASRTRGALRRAHPPPFERGDVGDAGELRHQGGLAGPDEVQRASPRIGGGYERPRARRTRTPRRRRRGETQRLAIRGET